MLLFLFGYYLVDFINFPSFSLIDRKYYYKKSNPTKRRFLTSSSPFCIFSVKNYPTSFKSKITVEIEDYSQELLHHVKNSSESDLTLEFLTNNS